MLYSTDASIYQVEPIGVVLPRHMDDVRAFVEFCGRHNLPILPRGGDAVPVQMIKDGITAAVEALQGDD